MIIHYITPTNTSLSPFHPDQTHSRKKYRLSNLKLRTCTYLPDITYYIESETNDFVLRFCNKGRWRCRYIRLIRFI